MKQYWPLIGLCMLSAVAYQWPEWFPEQADPFQLSTPWMGQLFACTMFVIGCLIPRDELRRVLRRWPQVIGGTAIQYTAMPLLAYSVARLAGLEGDLLIGVILVGCVPGAMASNVVTLTARGNVSYSVSLTTSATMLSPVFVPIALYVAVDVAGIDRQSMATKAFWQLTWQVVGPVLLGRFIASRWSSVETWMGRLGPWLANAVIIWIIAWVVNRNRNSLASATGLILGALLLINVLGYCAGWAGGRMMKLPDDMRRALTIEVGMQNAGLGSVLAGDLFREQAIVSLPPAIYTFGCMLTGSLLAQLWARWTPTELGDGLPRANELP